MMRLADNAPYVGLIVLIVIGVLFYIESLCRANPAIRFRRRWIQAFLLLWIVIALYRGILVTDVTSLGDSVLNDEYGHKLASELRSGRLMKVAGQIAPGNAGYRVLVGVLYAVTGSPEVMVYAINSAFGFCGMLSLLAGVSAHSRATRIPLPLVFATVGLPSAIFWSAFNLKEGLMLWSICMMLQATFSEEGRVPRKSIVGMCVAAFMRPHIAIAWLVAIAAGASTRRGNFRVAIMAMITVLAAWSAFKVLAPDLVETAENVGVVSTLEDRYQVYSTHDLGGSAITRDGAPIPLISGLSLILLEPMPHQVFDARSAAAGLEVWALCSLVLVGWLRCPSQRRKLFLSPTVLTALLAIILFALPFSYVYNMGLLVRQRVQIFPAVIILAGTPWLRLAVAKQQRRAQHRIVPTCPTTVELQT